MTDHARWTDAAGAYLLGALEEHERAGYEAHLDGCAQCREDIEFLRVASDALPSSVEQLNAPSALKDRIMTVVNAEAELLRAAGPEADRPPAPERRERRWWQLVPRPALAMAASMLLVVGGVTGWVLRDGGGGGGSASCSVTAEVTAEGAPDATACLVMRDEHSTLVARKLPRPGTGRVYQVWLRRKGRKAPEPTDALFNVRHDGSASVDVPGSLDDVESVLVTAEPEGGSQAPTSKPIISATPT